jgi:hypothetical protein
MSEEKEEEVKEQEGFLIRNNISTRLNLYDKTEIDIIEDKDILYNYMESLKDRCHIIKIDLEYSEKNSEWYSRALKALKVYEISIVWTKRRITFLNKALDIKEPKAEK